MTLLIDGLGILGLTGLVMTGLLGGGLGVAMGALLVVGLIDGPRGGRLAERVGGVSHTEDRDRTPTARRRQAA